MGVACSTYGGKGGAYTVLVGKSGESDHLDDPGVGGRVVLR
jgi:hypothetical protein